MSLLLKYEYNENFTIGLRLLKVKMYGEIRHHHSLTLKLNEHKV